jgi:LAO/AO transport system kinase
VGKSTLVRALAVEMRRGGEAVGVVAVDPTSPFTGGALLGDRVRMSEVGMDPGVFIRSMATRGQLGGISRVTFEACDLLDASGKAFVLVETVGVGQSEVEVVRNVDTVVVVLSPDSGDSIQAMKAGIMEIADLLVINKADRPGADRFEAELTAVLDLASRPRGRPAPQILRTMAQTGEGVADLLAAARALHADMRRTEELQRRRRENLKVKLRSMARARLEQALFENAAVAAALEAHLDAISAGREGPYEAVDELLAAAWDGRNRTLL